MGKTPKDSKKTSKKNIPSDSIFNKIFGNIVSEENGTNSIFSDSNPFRRKDVDTMKQPNELDMGSKIDDANVELKTSKRKREKKQGIDSVSFEEASETLSEKKESKKKLKEVISDVGIESNNISTDNDRKSLDFGSKTKKTSRKSASKSNMELNNDEKMHDNLVLGLGTIGFTNLGTRKEVSGTKKENQKKRKRKREEVETEYEEKRYGVTKELEGGQEGVVEKKVVGEKRKKLDNSTEMLISKEGFDDESKLLRTVFVGNLPLKVKKKSLIKEFSQFGEIESVRIRSVPVLDSKTPRKGAIMKKQINDAVDKVHAYIVFKTEESAQTSLTHNMAVVEGNHLRVDRACPPRKKMKEDNASASLYDNKRTVFVGNLPFDIKDEEVYKLFCGIQGLKSSVEAVRVVRHEHTLLGKGIAYVLFKTGEAVSWAVKQKLTLHDRVLRLSRAIPEAKPSKKIDADLSYQGLRATKSGDQKKFRSKPVEPTASNTKKVENVKARQNKRPAVAARKAALTGASASPKPSPKSFGKKRKPQSRTPDSGRKKKQFKKSK